MIPLKWKIFRISNLVQLIGLLVCIAFLLRRFLQDTSQGASFFAVFASGFLIMAATNYFNLFVFNKYFPARLIPSILKKINIILLIVGLVLSALLVVIIVVGSMEEFDGRDGSYAGKIALLIFTAMLINWVYILCMQIKMFNVIKRESYTSITNTINSIGQE